METARTLRLKQYWQARFLGAVEGLRLRRLPALEALMDVREGGIVEWAAPIEYGLLLSDHDLHPHITSPRLQGVVNSV